MSFLSQLVEGVANGLGASKKDVRSKRLRNSPGDAAKDTGSALFAEAIDEVSDFVEGGLRGMANVLVSKLEAQSKRLDEAEARASTQEKLLQSIISDMADTNAALKAQLSRLEKRTAHIESELEAAKNLVAANSSGPSASRPSPSDAPPVVDSSDKATPYECRTFARMGNFPWNTPAKDLVRMAKEALTAAGVPDAHWRHLHAPRNPGSSVELEFNEAAHLQSARFAIRCAAHHVGDKVVWLDAAKTRDELRPARLTHRGAAALTDLESKRPDTSRGVVDKVMTGKQVKVANDVMGYSAYGNWIWTNAASERYDVDSLNMMKAWVESP